MTMTSTADAPGETPDVHQGTYFERKRAALLLASLFLVSIFAQIDRILPFILAEAIKAEMRLTDTQIGLITGIAFALCYVLLSLPMARQCDRGSPRNVLLACTLVWSAMTALGGFAVGFASLAASRLGVALGEAGAVPAGHTLIARKIRPDRRGFSLGLFSMGIPIGTMVGFGAGGAVADAFGWRVALVGAGLCGAAIGLLAFWAAGPTPPLARPDAGTSFWRSSRALLATPAFRALFIAAVSIGFAAAPFYAFAATFLIRTHALTATEAGIAFGLLQGLLGAAGTLLGGRGFDAARRRGSHALLRQPAIAFCVAALTTTAALFAPLPWMAIALFVPAMFSFAFMLPYAFGAAHLVAGEGHEGMASSIALIGSGLLGPALGPLIVGLASDVAGAAGIANTLGIGLLLVPIACVTTALASLAASRRIATFRHAVA